KSVYFTTTLQATLVVVMKKALNRADVMQAHCPRRRPTAIDEIGNPGLFNEEVLMATLVVIDYESEVKAEEVRLALLKMQKEYLIDLADAVVVVRDAKGKVKLRQLYALTAAGAASGGFWGALIGLLFLNPLFGFAIGAAAGAVSGALRD